MNLPLPFYLAAAVAGTLACSDGGTTTRPGNTSGGSAGQTGVVNNTAGTGGASGISTGTSGAGGGGSGTTSMGPALTITANGTTTATVVDSVGTTGLNGLAQVIKSPMGTTVTAGFKDGGLCMNGTTVVVPNMDYTNYWGAEIDLDVKLTDAPAAAGGGTPAPAAADAGADAGGDAGGVAPPAQVPVGWNASAANVVGFSFTLDGAKVPVAFRFKGLPFGADSSKTTYCNQVVAAASGPTTVNVRFDQITFECWNPGGAAVLTEPFPPDNADGKLLRTLSWQVPADINIPFPFDFCVSDIKPILGN